MNYIGKWRFHSIGVINESGELTYMGAEKYLNSPMPYIDESDEDAVKDEIKERKQIIGGCVEICENGKMYMLMQLPEDVSQEDVDAAVAVGEISLRNGMLCSGVVSWEERNGELWFDSGIEGEAFGEATDTWIKGIDESGLFTFMTMRYEKE